MVDLLRQYNKISKEIDENIKKVILTSAFINGEEVKKFQHNLEKYLNVKNVIPCANGTDALQIALMSLDLSPGDEVIIPDFTFVATVEVVALLSLKPVLVDVDYDTFNININQIEQSITKKTKAIIPVHLFGQCANMEKILDIAKAHNLYVIEDAAQSLGAEYIFKNGTRKKAGTIGDIGCTSFFPSKNLGAYGDGGAIFTNNDELASKIKAIANHGQRKRYFYDCVGVNSRLDSIQATILNVKLKYYNEYLSARQQAANHYNKAFNDNEFIETPVTAPFSTHVFHQYTLKIKNGLRDKLKKFLSDNEIPTMIYYPYPLHKQKAYKNYNFKNNFKISNKLCSEVLSLPMHTELDNEQLNYITDKIIEFIGNYIS